MSLFVTLAADALVAVLLAATIVTSLRLSRRIGQLKGDEAALRGTIADLMTATGSAERAIAGLRAAIDECDRTLDARIEAAGARAADLARQCEAGEGVLARIGAIVTQIGLRPEAPAPRRAAEPPEPAPRREAAYREPARRETAHRERTYGERAYGEPASGDPALREPARREPAYRDAAHPEPAPRESAYRESVRRPSAYREPEIGPDAARHREPVRRPAPDRAEAEGPNGERLGAAAAAALAMTERALARVRGRAA